MGREIPNKKKRRETKKTKTGGRGTNSKTNVERERGGETCLWEGVGVCVGVPGVCPSPRGGTRPPVVGGERDDGEVCEKKNASALLYNFLPPAFSGGAPPLSLSVCACVRARRCALLLRGYLDRVRRPDRALPPPPPHARTWRASKTPFLRRAQKRKIKCVHTRCALGRRPAPSLGPRPPLHPPGHLARRTKPRPGWSARQRADLGRRRASPKAATPDAPRRRRGRPPPPLPPPPPPPFRLLSWPARRVAACPACSASRPMCRLCRLLSG